MNTGRWRDWLLRAVVTAVFAGAGALKAWDPAEFAFAIDRYRLVPWSAAAGLALYLPWLELAGALGLWFRPARGAARGLLMGLTGIFLVALASAWGRGLDIDCGCFGAAGAGDLSLALLRASGLLALLWMLGRAETPVSGLSPRPTPGDR